jgi:hypothetical protein
MMPSNLNCIHEGITSRLNLDITCYHSVFLPCYLKIYKTIILSAVLYEYETWSVTLWKVHGLKVFKSRVPRRVFGPKMDETADSR